MELPQKGEVVPLSKIEEICRLYGLHDLWEKIQTDRPAKPFASDGCSLWVLSSFTVFRDKYFWREDRNREETNWYRFQAAVKDHERYAINLLSPLFAQIGVSLKDA